MLAGHGFTCFSCNFFSVLPRSASFLGNLTYQKQGRALLQDWNSIQEFILPYTTST